jgi:hypothetical protein
MRSKPHDRLTKKPFTNPVTNGTVSIRLIPLDFGSIELRLSKCLHAFRTMCARPLSMGCWHTYVVRIPQGEHDAQSILSAT